MLLAPKEAERFFKLHHSLMWFVNERLGIVPNVDSPEAFAALPPERRIEVRNAFLGETELLQAFINENPADLSAEELDVVRSWRHQVAGRFLIFRYLKKYTVFLSVEDPPIAYGVVSLAEPLEHLVGPYLPVMVEGVLLPLRDKIIYDGLIRRYNVTFGGGARRGFNEAYKEAKERLGVVTSPPIEQQQVLPTQAPKKPKPKAAGKASERVRPALEQIIHLTDQFCGEQLNEEYAELCRKLAGKLARKRPSPLLSGKPATWASAIVRTIGWVNFLHDPAMTPHMKLAEIDEAFGVSPSTGQAKSKTIRDALRIVQLDPEWTLPSQMEDNLLVWMLEVDGFMMDVRDCPREIQEIAYEKGLIPYIPADREPE